MRAAAVDGGACARVVAGAGYESVHDMNVGLEAGPDGEEPDVGAGVNDGVAVRDGYPAVEGVGALLEDLPVQEPGFGLRADCQEWAMPDGRRRRIWMGGGGGGGREVQADRTVLVS